MKYLLLDDIRDAETTFNWTKNTIYSLNEWDLVLNYTEFVKYIEINGLPDVISFDHDLADEHYVPQEYWEPYEKSAEYQSNQKYTEKTGNDCAKWLVEYCINNKLDLPKCLVHSANPIGADRIRKTLLDFDKYKINNI